MQGTGGAQTWGSACDERFGVKLYFTVVFLLAPPIALPHIDVCLKTVCHLPWSHVATWQVTSGGRAFETVT